MKKFLFMLIVVSIAGMLIAECDMMGMVSSKGRFLSWENQGSGFYDDPQDYLNWIKARSTGSTSKPNPDGYGLLYYPEDGSFYYNTSNENDPNNQAWYLTGTNTYYNHTDPTDSNNDQFDLGEAKILNDGTAAALVLGHARQGTGGVGNHPFRFDYNGKTYSFIHNGFTKTENYDYLNSSLINYLNSISWSYDSNWNPSGTVYNDWVDSEVLFHYIMAHIIAVEGDTYKGLYEALNDTLFNISNQIQDPTTFHHIVNFALSDGESIYLFRNFSDADHKLSINTNLFNGGLAFRTGGASQDSWGTELPINNLIVLSPDGLFPTQTNLWYVFNSSITTDNLLSGTITTNTLIDTVIFVTDDLTIASNAELTIGDGGTLYFWNGRDITVEGTLTLEDGATINLDNGTTVYVEDTGVFNLEWGCEVSGETSTTYGATPPGQQPGGEPSYHGDRIIARDGGKITTKTKLQYDTTPGDEIIIKGQNGQQWDGIFIDTPNNLTDLWFVNCDISGIDNFSIRTPGFATSAPVNLNLIYTDFHDAGEIVVRNGHTLTMHGEAGNYSYIQNNYGSISAYESPIDLEYVCIGGETENDNLGNGSGIYLYDSALQSSYINNCNFQYNGDNGLTTNSVTIAEFNYNVIKENTKFGMLCYDGTVFDRDEFKYITLSNNGLAEYAGYHTTFKMENLSANIMVDDDNYSGGLDNYLLMNLNWNETDAVNIKGTNIYSLDNLYPTNSLAWTYFPQITGSQELLNLAEIDFANENYTDARVLLYEILDDYLYSPEAIAACYYLYHIEVKTSTNCGQLRTYLDGLKIDTKEPIYNVVQMIYAKTLIKDNEYAIAIDILEDIVLNSDVPDEVITALIDQGYAYLQLLESGERALPTRCSAKVTSFKEYQAKVRELETQYSFYPAEQEEPIPTTIEVLTVSNYPNPFNPTTTISFNLATDSNVSVEVYNVKGQKVKTLLNQKMVAGNNNVVWNGNDNNGNNVSSGIYFYKVETNQATVMKKIILLK